MQVGKKIGVALAALAAVLGAMLPGSAQAAPPQGEVPAGCVRVGEVENGPGQGGTANVVVPAGQDEIRLRYDMFYNATNQALGLSITDATGAEVVTDRLSATAGSEGYSVAPGAYTVAIEPFADTSFVADQRATTEVFTCSTALDTAGDPAAGPLESGVVAVNEGAGIDTTQPIDLTRVHEVRLAYDIRGGAATITLTNPALQTPRIRVIARGDGHVDFPISFARNQTLGTGFGTGLRVDGWRVNVDVSPGTTYRVEASTRAQTGTFNGSFEGFPAPSDLECGRSVGGGGIIETTVGNTVAITPEDSEKDLILALRNYTGPDPAYVFITGPDGEIIFEDTFGIEDDTTRIPAPEGGFTPGEYRLETSAGVGNATQAALYVECAPLPPPPDPEPENAEPDARDDSANTRENRAVSVDVLRNDTDADGDRLSISSVGEPRNGTARVEGGQVRYIPDRGFSGRDSFRYTVSDGNGGTDTATVSVRVTPAPTPPPPTPEKPDKPDRCERDKGGVKGKAKAGSAVAKGDTRGEGVRGVAKTENVRAAGKTSCKGVTSAVAGDIRIKNGKLKIK